MKPSEVIKEMLERRKVLAAMPKPVLRRLVPEGAVGCDIRRLTKEECVEVILDEEYEYCVELLDKAHFLEK